MFNSKVILTTMLILTTSTIETTPAFSNNVTRQQKQSLPLIATSFNLADNPKCHLISGRTLQLYLNITEDRILKHPNVKRFELQFICHETGNISWTWDDHRTYPEKRQMTFRIGLIEKYQKLPNPPVYRMRIVNTKDNATWHSNTIIDIAKISFDCFQNRNITITGTERGPTTLKLTWTFTSVLRSIYKPKYFFVRGKKDGGKKIRKKRVLIDDVSRCKHKDPVFDCEYTLHNMEECSTYEICVKIRLKWSAIDNGSANHTLKECITSKPNKPNKTNKCEPSRKKHLTTKRIIILTFTIVLLCLLFASCICLTRQNYRLPNEWQRLTKGCGCYINDEVLVPRDDDRSMESSIANGEATEVAVFCNDLQPIGNPDVLPRDINQPVEPVYEKIDDVIPAIKQTKKEIDIVRLDGNSDNNGWNIHANSGDSEWNSGGTSGYGSYTM